MGKIGGKIVEFFRNMYEEERVIAREERERIESLPYDAQMSEEEYIRQCEARALRYSMRDCMANNMGCLNPEVLEMFDDGREC